MSVANVFNGLRPSAAGAGAAAEAAQKIAPETAVTKTRRRLFSKYVALFVAVVCIALVSNGIFDVLFYYREHKVSLIRIQREQAEAAAAKIGQFIKEIESQLSCPVQRARSSSAGSTRCGCCAKSPPSPSLRSSMPPAKSDCGCRGLRWTWWQAAPTSPVTRNSQKR
jgi:hypothetical protein